MVFHFDQIPHAPDIIEVMTKIRDIARFTQVVTGEAAPTSSRRGNPNNPAFVKVQALRHNEAMTLRDLTYAAVQEHSQPLTVAEITAFLNQVLGTDYNEPRVRYGLDALVKDKKLFTRSETAQERTLRGNGAKVTLNKPAVLYSTYSVVPPRTVCEVVPGVILRGVDSPRPRKQRDISHLTPKETRTQTPNLDTAALDFLIEKIVAERTVDLQKKLDEANKKLSALKKLID
jgi:hypothetical protein